MPVGNTILNKNYFNDVNSTLVSLQVWMVSRSVDTEMWTFYTPWMSVTVSGDFCRETARKFTKF